MSKTLIIGGGAAGCVAAVTAARRGDEVTLYDRNEVLARKLRLTGKGRCNLTNNCDFNTLIANVVTNGKFLYSAMRRFPPADTMEFFEALGVPLKTERGGRVFPVSDNANDVADALEREMLRLGVTIIKERFDDKGKIKKLLLAGGRVIIATGGLSYPATGSTGDGYAIARAFGHNIIEPRPRLVPLTSDDAACGDLQGLSLKNASVKLKAGGKTLFEDFGEMQFTHFGVSGPLVLSASCHLPPDCPNVTLEIDLKPALDFETLDKRLQRDFEKYSNRDFSNALDDLAPPLLRPVLVRGSGIAPGKKVHSITKPERLALAGLFKCFTLNITGTRPLSEAVISSGGVDVREVNPSTMESKLAPGLYFCGEVLDTDAYTGGFNLQIAWATGRVAGS
ncbi:MAG: NAD(P)/FAD-dependent oxidoreductase [Oscillospiraceae bacterium]|jgi:predicted Rossmann fold flavoprotein|nr:NAD(P)/FAD-dependent oxidoreductase [Oscillospiraceae bacterium]